jgi:hypothetical protein
MRAVPHEGVVVERPRSNRAMGQRSQEEVERVCMRNRLASGAERVFFKDRESRFVLVSAWWLPLPADDVAALRATARATRSQ